MVAALIDADLLILMSDIDGLFTDDPNSNPDAQFIDIVENMDDNMRKLGKSSTGSNVGTGGMATKLTAAIIATAAGADMAPAPMRGRAAPHRAGGRAVHRDRRQAAQLLSGLRPEADGAADRRPAAGLPGGTARHDPMRSLLRCEPCTRPLLFRHGPCHGRR